MAMSSEKLLSYLKVNPFVLAPMAGITDHAFRSFMKELGAGVVVTELISATGIEYKSKRTLKLMSFDDSQRPVGIQLFGDDPVNMSEAALVAQDLGCDFIDLNFGCPVPKVVKKGAGSAMLKDPVGLAKMVREVKSKLQIPLTIKIRIGWDENSKNAEEICHIAHEEGVTWVAIHGRTRAAGYSGLADWNLISEVKSKVKVPIIGNGDIITPGMANSRLLDSKVDAVMIGRGCLKNPFIFKDALKIYKGDKIDTAEPRDLWVAYNLLKNHLTAHCDEPILQIQLKKFAAWYSTGYGGASQFRKHIFETKSVSEVLFTAERFFREVQISQQEDTSHQPFLMGGHG